MTRRPLSLAAQNVDAAARAAWVTKDCPQNIAAAALRAAADQVLPAASPRDRATWSPFAGQIRSELLAIAAELEGADG